MAKYKFAKDSATGKELPFILLGENIAIPKDPNNVDYQLYLEWAKTNTTDPAD
tara:strand:+ start:999 stop:1157 length:159 start_codon:yes stop_codon:yes gene_type:complete